MKPIGAAAITPAHLVQHEERLQCVMALLIRLGAIEAHLKFLFQLAESSLKVIAMSASERGEIRLPVMAGQIDVRADVRYGLRVTPSPLFESSRKLRGKAGIFFDLRKLQHVSFTVQEFTQNVQDLPLHSMPDNQ